jgi:succinoglycan biosynthesis protein ExoM
LLLTVGGVRACPLPAGFALEIVVADDSLDGAASALLAQLDNRTGLHLVSSAAKNISLARNACVSRSSGEYVVFIDDDEVPDCAWLERLIGLAESSHADAVQGSVVGIYPDSAPAWATTLRPFDKAYGQAGERLQVGSTCNLLVRRSSLSQRGLQFDPAFGNSGGEDTDFCYRLTASGGVIVCSPDAVVYENVPLGRLTFRHLIRRYARGGHTYASVVLAKQGVGRKTLELGKALVLATAYSVLATVSSLARPAASVRYSLRVSGNVGKLIFFLGLPAWNLY